MEDVSKDISYLIIRKTEKGKLGVLMQSLINKKVKQRAAIAFVDDMNFYTNSRLCNKKIQQITNTYTRLCKGIGRAIKQEKSYTHRW